MEGNMLLLVLVLWPILGAFVGYVIGLKNKSLLTYFVSIVTLVELVVLAVGGIRVVSGDSMYFFLDHVCGMGISFALDGFRYSYGLLTALAFFVTTIFSREYLQGDKKSNRYYFFTLITFAACIGIFLSGDLFTTFIFFEIMSFTSYVWVAHDETKKSFLAAKTYLFVAIICGLIMLMGLFLLYAKIGTLRIDELSHAVSQLDDITMIRVAGVLLLFGFGAKAGMYPLHVWLPNAYEEAPAPATALLSSILSKTGIFGVLVLSSKLLLHDASFGMTLLLLGLFTMVGGAILAVFTMNLKRVLACSSMSQIGFIFVGIGMQGLLGEHNQLAVRGTYLHMVNHTMIKLVLFLAAGVVFMNLKTYHLNEIRGFGRKKPILMFSFFMGALGVTGIPLWNGYVSKTLLHESILEYKEFVFGQPIERFFTFVEWAFLISGGLTVAYMLKVIIALFFEKSEEQSKEESSNKNYMNQSTGAVLLLCAIILPLLGMTPNVTMDSLADIAQGFMHGHALEHAVSYFSFENISGALISISIGVVVYFGLIRRGLMRRSESGRLEYVELWPVWMNLEEVIYRPIITKALPFIFAVVSRLLDKSVDGIALLLSKTILRPARSRRPVQYCSRGIYVFGSVLDDIVLFMNRTIRKKKPIKISFINLFTVGRTEMDRTSRLVTRSVSFGLLLVCVGLLLTLVYLLLV